MSVSLQAMEKYPETNAVLVRRHGVYVWGGKLMIDCFCLNNTYCIIKKISTHILIMI